MSNFQPSGYSFEAADLPLQTDYLTDDMGEPITIGILLASAIIAGTAAAGAGTVAIANAAYSKDQRYVKAYEKTMKYKLAYNKCRERRENKGKEAYPQDKSKSITATNCHSDYIKWMSWQEKKSERAAQLEEKLAKKDKLSEDVAEELDEAKKEARSEKQKLRDHARNRRQQVSDQDLAVDPAALMEAQAELDAIPEEEGMGLTPFLLVGGIVALAGGAYYFMSKGD